MNNNEMLEEQEIDLLDFVISMLEQWMASGWAYMYAPSAGSQIRARYEKL